MKLKEIQLGRKEEVERWENSENKIWAGQQQAYYILRNVPGYGV